MHAARFDDLVRALADAPALRASVRRAVAATGGDAAPSRRAGANAAPTDAARSSGGRGSVCANSDVSDLQNRPPGELIAHEEITDPADPDFPANSRAWRVLYVSTGRDNTERTLVCGVVVAPVDPARLAVDRSGGTAIGRVVAWCHGTLGLPRRCQPSEQPAPAIWGEPPYGIGPVAWGSTERGDHHIGTPENGILAGMIDAGWIVAAIDYGLGRAPDGSERQPWIVGKIQAANAVDSVRAAHHLLAAMFDGYRLAAYDVVPWGHSQGGHAAIWTGQVLEPYAAATVGPGDPALALAGVVAEAPGSNFVTQPDRQGEDAFGFGLFDWITHTQLQPTGVPEAIPLAPFFLSYAFAAWSAHAAGLAPDPDQMPAWPDVGPLDVSAVVQPGAERTVEQMAGLCWADGARVAALAAPFRTTPFLVEALADGPAIDGRQHGNWDRICAGDPPPGIAAWCAWLRYNIPGPFGDHPLPKLPTRAGRLVPVLIAAGSNDGIVHCVAPDPAEVPSANDCAPAALYAALKAEYCPNGEPRGHLALRIWRAEPGVTAADHSDITGLVAAKGLDDPRFAGSPLQRFIAAAFDGTLEPGCSAEVVNGPRPV